MKRDGVIHEQQESRTGKINGRVLIVEDERAERDLLSHILLSNGLDVVAVNNGNEALSVLKDGRIDVVLSDIRMPELDGFNLCRCIKGNQQTAHIPVLLVTAFSQAENRIKGIESGVDHFLTKPIDFNEVVLRIRNVVTAKKLYDRLQVSYHQLRELEEVREKITHMLVHDLRWILLGILGNTELLKLESAHKFNRESANYLEKIETNSEMLLDLLGKILDISTREDEIMPVDVQTANLREIMNKMLGLQNIVPQTGTSSL